MIKNEKEFMKHLNEVLNGYKSFKSLSIEWNNVTEPWFELTCYGCDHYCVDEADARDAVVDGNVIRERMIMESDRVVTNGAKLLSDFTLDSTEFNQFMDFVVMAMNEVLKVPSEIGPTDCQN